MVRPDHPRVCVFCVRVERPFSSSGPVIPNAGENHSGVASSALCAAVGVQNCSNSDVWLLEPPTITSGAPSPQGCGNWPTKTI